MIVSILSFFIVFLLFIITSSKHPPLAAHLFLLKPK
nr:MAG TPA: hypothetical protein [Caudoviricetes sp.]